jgi:HD superfamily phosphohydrolase YqeK
MSSFADQAGITVEQAVNAGLLHDLCKAMQGPELLEAARRYGIEPSALQRKRPTLLHGAVAAEECRRDLRITDGAVLDAIYWHTTGRPEWSDAGLALYVADFAEPLRLRPEADEARAVLERDGFIPALRYVLRTKLDYVRKHYQPDPMSEAFERWVYERFGP